MPSQVDYTLLLLGVILMLVLCLVFQLNQIKTTPHVGELFRMVQKFNPTTVAFCMGRTADGRRFRNAVLSHTGTVQEAVMSYPVTLDGSPIYIREHGAIVPDTVGGGFHVEGIGLDRTVVFRCPPGYGGYPCKPLPICAADDAVGTVKPIRYAQFRALDLYGVGGPFEQRSSDDGTFRSKRSTADPIHPRIRALCTGNERHQLQICPNNTLLDETSLECVPYDVCQDRLNGYRHNDIIVRGQPPLTNAQYYICAGNVSSMSTCPHDTVYDAAAKGCVTTSPCLNKGSITLAGPTENTYIQCANDTGSVVRCENGVQRTAVSGPDGTSGYAYVCAPGTIKCEPRPFMVTTDQLRYASGGIHCPDGPDGAAVRRLCTTRTTDRTVRKRWIESFDITVPNWPDRIWDQASGACVEPTHDIIASSMPVQFSALMPDAYDYDLQRERYVCSTDSDYRWDYDTGVLVPPGPAGRIFNPGVPCHAGPLEPGSGDLPQEPILPLPIVDKATGRAVAPPCGYSVSVLSPRLERGLWPVRIPDDGSYRWCGATETDTHLTVVEFTSADTAPRGFVDPSAITAAASEGPRRLHLLGTDGAELDIDDRHQYYVFPLGTVRLPAAPDATSTELVRAPLVNAGDSVSLLADTLIAVGARYLRQYRGADTTVRTLCPGFVLQLGRQPASVAFATATYPLDYMVVEIIAPSGPEQSVALVSVGPVATVAIRVRQPGRESDAAFWQRMAPRGFREVAIVEGTAVSAGSDADNDTNDNDGNDGRMTTFEYQTALVF